MVEIFISYSHKNETVTRSLVDDIEALGHAVWFDHELTGGQAWWDKILAKVRDCDLFVFVLDPESLDSTACKLEYGYAADLGKSILPVLVANDVSTKLLPIALSQIQFVDYRKKDRSAALALARAIATVPPPKPLPDPLPSPPQAPISYLANLAEKVETTTTLSYESQCALLVDLKKSLRDTENADDTRMLIERLRKRRDLFVTIGEEIDDLVIGSRESSIVASGVSDSESSSFGRSNKDDTPSTLDLSEPRQRPASRPLHKAPPKPTLIRRAIVASLTTLLLFVTGWLAGGLTEVATGSTELGLVLAFLIWILSLIIGTLAWRRGRIFGLKQFRRTGAKF